jgi:ribosome recycling factor
VEDRLKGAKRRMEGAVKTLTAEFASVRTGRASTSLLDRVSVDAYGTRTPLNQLATIHAPEPRLLTVQPFDRSIMQAVERALMESDLGLTPSNDGQLIRLPIPQLTEERRKELVRLDVMNEMKRAEKEGDFSRDELGRAQDEVQKLTDAEIKSIDELMARKEAEVLEV